VLIHASLLQRSQMQQAKKLGVHLDTHNSNQAAGSSNLSAATIGPAEKLKKNRHAQTPYAKTDVTSPAEAS